MAEKEAKKTKSAAKGGAKKGKTSSKSAARKGGKQSQKQSGKGAMQHAGERKIAGSATIRDIRISPRKARLMVDMVRGKQVEPALQILRFNPRKGARIVEKLLRSAINNAVERSSADVDKLWIVAAWVDAGRSLKRLMPRAQGRGDILTKRSSHITLQLGERK